MDKTIAARTAPLVGEYFPQGDKSLSHRALLFASLAEGTSVIRRFLVGGVTRAMLRCLRQLGVNWTLDEDAHVLTVEGRGLHGFTAPEEPLNCGNSATTLRLLAGAVAAAGVPCVLTGSEGLCRRPMGRIVEPLRAMGADVSAAEGSAQVKSCLLLAALAADGPTALTEPGPSRDHTERMLAAMGAAIKPLDPPAYGAVALPLTAPLRPLDLELPGDISSAAFLIVAATLLPGSDFTLRRIGVNPTRTGFLDALRAMGADITLLDETTLAGEPVADIRVRYAPLVATTVSGDLVVRMIDEFPAFMIAAACARGVTAVRDAAELRTKESDRIAGMAANLRAVGVEIHEQPDGFDIFGGAIPGGAAVDAHGDHRVAMSLALAALVAKRPITIAGFDILAESFPDFPTVLGL